MNCQRFFEIHRLRQMVALIVVMSVGCIFFGCLPAEGVLTDNDSRFDVLPEQEDTNEHSIAGQTELTPTEHFPLAPDYVAEVSEKEVMEIAMSDLDPRFYEATSTMLGPMEWADDQITAYEVTVRGVDDFLLRYIDAETGELLYDEVLPLRPGESEERDWIRWCPGGWPLCIQDPGTITFYSQRDASWRNDKLGYSNSLTIGSDGCLVSAYAMSLKQTGHGSRNPGTLNYRGKQWGCFSGPLVVSGCIASHTGANYATIGVNQVWSHIAAGIPVVVYGYSPCLGGYHAQMIWGHDGSRYWTKDPWYDWPDQDQPMCVNNPSFRLMR